MTKRYFKPTVTKSSGNSDPAFFRGWKLWKANDTLIGQYIGSYETTYRGQTAQNFRIKVLECNFKVEEKDSGKMVDPTGRTLILNGVGALNKFMDKVEEQMLVEVVYGGKQPGKDGTLYHTFTSLQAGHAEEVESGDVDAL